MNETIHIEELIQDQHNFNKGTAQGEKLMQKSLTELGAGRSILIDKDGNIIAGNKTQKAAIAAGIQKVRVIETDGTELVAVKRTDLSIDSKKGRELALADNLTTQVNLAWDAVELDNIAAQEGIDLEGWGLDPKDLGIEDPTETKEAQEDDFDEEKDPVATICKEGDVWQLGEHRLMCGDSTKAEDFERLMDGQKADISFTSPPYNAGSINQIGNESTQKKYDKYDDNKSSEEYLNFISTNVDLLIKHSCEVFYNIGLVSGNKKEIFQLITRHLNNFKDMIYWEKDTAAPCIQKGVVNNLVEFIIAFGDNGSRQFKNAQFSQGTYWNVIKGKNARDNEYSKIHKATFPVYLPSEIIKSFSPKGGSIIDCFGGTGTTLIAAEQLGRKCYMMELDPHYCDVIIARWEKLTGQKAIKIQ